MARVSQRLKNLDGAKELLQESIEIKEELGDDPGLATGFHELGSVFLMQDLLEDALDAYERALEIEEQHVDVQGLAVTHAQLGLVHRNLTNFPESVESFALARELLYRLRYSGENLRINTFFNCALGGASESPSQHGPFQFQGVIRGGF